MKTYKPLLGFLILIVLIISCQKERSYEKGNVPESSGSLQSGATGDCLGNVVSGIYKKDTALNSINYVDIKVDVTNTGSYLVSSDTINGISFKATGTFTTTGVNTVRLQGTGTPAAPGTAIFTVTYDSTQCTFSISTLNGGSGGTSAFTLAGSPNACAGASVQGIYTAGITTNAANTATIQVNVTTAGTYAISTSAVDGITFSASGTFSSTGAQSINLTASGTPAATGSFNIPISAGSSNCSFQVTVVGASPAVYTLNGAPGNCTGAILQGIYVVGTPLTTSNTAAVQVNVATAGTYSITTTAVNGISFTGSGTFSSTGVQSVVLIGSGTPAAVGSFTIPVTVGASSCSFPLTVSPVDYFPRTTNSNWSYSLFDSTGAQIDTLLRNVISQTLSAISNTYNIFMETTNASAGFDSSGYYRRVSGNYYQYFNVGNFFSADGPVWGENIFLEDNVASGTSWTTAFTVSFNSTPTSVRFKETIQQKDVPITIGTTVYQNTIVVREDYEYFDGANWSPVFTGNPYSLYYFSRNIGLIKLQVVDDTGTKFNQEINRSQVF
ncbi:MAG: hypothetical protein ACHQF0_08060 [Chitinophagales bacterium]